jgi:hypothetical protein
MTFPFEVSFEHVQATPDAYIEAIFTSLVSDFLVLPRGQGFVEYPVFERGYEALKQATAGFREVAPATLEAVVIDVPIALKVFTFNLLDRLVHWGVISSLGGADVLQQMRSAPFESQKVMSSSDRRHSL